MIDKQAASDTVKEVDERLEEEVKASSVADVKVVEEAKEESKGDVVNQQDENKKDSAAAAKDDAAEAK